MLSIENVLNFRERVVNINKKVKYDKNQDILYVHKGGKEADSLPIGDFIVEFSHDNKVVGIEVLNASKNLSAITEHDISKEDLQSIMDADVRMSTSGRLALVFLKFVYKKKGTKKEEKIHLNMPESVPKVPA